MRVTGIPSLYDALRELYKTADGETISSELAADLVGDYLFSDPDFIKELLVEDKNLFHKVWREIKDLIKIVTPGTKEAKRLEKVEREFKKVFDEFKVSGETVEDTKYSVSKNANKSIDNSSENSYNLYTATDDFIRQVSYGERHAFARSLANKTSGMTEGETRIIYVSGYIFEADGYMQGRILAPYNSETKKLLGEKRLNMGKLTKTERVLLYGLKQFKMPSEEAAAISVYLEEDEQVLMIDYLANHRNASHQEIMNEFGRLLSQKQSVTK